MTNNPTVPDHKILPLFVDRYNRLTWTLQDVTLSELQQIQTREAFVALYTLQDQFIAGLFWDKIMRPILDAYYACQRQHTLIQKLQSELNSALTAFSAQAANATVSANEGHLRSIRGKETRLAEETAEFNRLCAALAAFFPRADNVRNDNVITHVQPNDQTNPNCTNK